MPILAKACILFILLSQAVSAQEILPLREVRAGQTGVGKSVFQGFTPEEFQVEILGVLQNIGPRQNIILARLSGGPLGKTGVMQGMSGSPVWIGGKLIGAVALAFPFSKEPIAGIRPIEEMLSTGPAAPPGPARAEAKFGESRLTEVATPVSFSGFTPRTIEHFSTALRKLGLEPQQGLGGQAAASGRGSLPKLEPGSMISVQLVSGDLAIGADGTVTMIDGDKIYAFGHRFLGLGSAEMPFARSEVITVLPSLASSFKISAGRAAIGTITQDGNAAIAGQLGQASGMIPVTLDVTGSRRTTYRMEIFPNPVFTPFLLQMALFSAIDGTERTMGSSTISIQGQVRFAGGLAPLKIDQAYSSDVNAPVVASISAVAPVATMLQSASEPVRITGIDLAIRAEESRKLWQIDNLTSSRRQARPDDTVRLAIVLSGPDGREEVRTIDYRIPVGTPVGPLFVTAADALTANLAEHRLMPGAQSRPARQILDQLNDARGTGNIWLRVWQQDASYPVAGTELSNLPAGLSLLLRKTALQQPFGLGGGSTLQMTGIPINGAAITGGKTIQLEIRE